MLTKRGLPSKAGLANLLWIDKMTDPPTNEPIRVGSVIKIPHLDKVGFHSLKGGTQFILYYPWRIYSCRGHLRYETGTESMVYFGGTDEKPFLVRLQESIYRKSTKGEKSSLNEKEFFELLIPPIIKWYRQAFRSSFLRQGDWFVAPMKGYSWEKLIKTVLVGRREYLKPKVVECHLADTRHVFKGRLSVWDKVQEDNDGSTVHQPVYIGEGVLTAPDHSPLVTPKGGPSIIAQAQNFYKPSNAD